MTTSGGDRESLTSGPSSVISILGVVVHLFTLLFMYLVVCVLFCVQLNSILETTLPVSRAKMTAITKAATNARKVS